MSNENEDDNEDSEVELDEEEIVVGDEPKRILYQLSSPSIQSLHERYKEGDLLLHPDFQRGYVWNKKKASNLIESVILNIPLPLIYTAEIDGTREEVIDGQQRLTSIFSYIDGTFPDGEAFRVNKRLKVLSAEIGGKSFSELDKFYQKEIKRRSLQIITINRASQEDVKFEMFERLNTNITALNAQELRNCLYRGRYNNFIKRMAKFEDFQHILNKPKFKSRMQDVQNVLMFCAFFHTSPDRYSKSLTQLLNEDMREYSNLSLEHEEELERQFKKCVRLIRTIWDDKAFSICTLNEPTKSLHWSNQFNQGLFQILMYWFTPYEANHVMPHIDLLREELINLLLHDDNFKDTLTGSGTNSPKKVRMKFDIWGNTVKGVLKYPCAEPRAFSINLKQQLWNSNQTCEICGQQISHVDDSEIDHIICYWRGGKTIPQNARLTHRFCNRRRGGKSIEAV